MDIDRFLKREFRKKWRCMDGWTDRWMDYMVYIVTKFSKSKYCSLNIIFKKY